MHNNWASLGCWTCMVNFILMLSCSIVSNFLSVLIRRISVSKLIFMIKQSQNQQNLNISEQASLVCGFAHVQWSFSLLKSVWFLHQRPVKGVVVHKESCCGQCIWVWLLFLRRIWTSTQETCFTSLPSSITKPSRQIPDWSPSLAIANTHTTAGRTELVFLWQSWLHCTSGLFSGILQISAREL